MNLKKGDVVKLNSGGPEMTISEIENFSEFSSEKQAKCIWFDKGELREAIFHLEAICVAKPNDWSNISSDSDR